MPESQSTGLPAPVSITPPLPAGTPSLPPPQPIAVAQDQPAATPAVLPPPAPVAAESAPPAPTEALPAPVNPSAQPIPEKTTGILDSLKNYIAPLREMVAGKGTWLGPETAGATVRETIQNPADAWRKDKIAAHNWLDSSLIIPYNGVTPEEAAANPKMAAASRGVSSVVQGLTTPASIGLILATVGMGEIPAVLERGIAAAGLDAATAARAAKVSKVALQGLGVYFTADQIAKVMESVPEVAQAVMTGQTNKAIELATSAVVNGVVAGAAAHETYKSIHGSVEAAAENSAMKHGDYADLVHDRQKTLQIAGGQKNQIADLGRNAAPDLKDREWATEYVEANKDRDVLRERQAQTKTGPTPTEQIAANQENKPLTVDLYRGGELGKTGKFGSTFYSDNPEYAKNFADEPGRTVEKETVTVKNPLNLQNPEHAKLFGQIVAESEGRPASEGVDLAKMAMSEGISHIPEKAAKALAARGFDFVVNDKDYTVGPSGKVYIKLPEAETSLGYDNNATQEVTASPNIASAGELLSPAAQHTLELQAALKDAQEAARDHVITPEERAAMVEQQDPDKQVSSEAQKAIDFVAEKMNYLKKQAQQRGLLPQGQVRENYVPHEYDFDDSGDPTKKRLFDTYHEAQQAGLVPKNKDYFALTSDYIAKMWNRIADADTISKLKSGRTEGGAPLAVPGGFVEGQQVATEGPQSALLDSQEIERLKNNGQLSDLIRSGRVVQTDDGFRWKADDYVKAKNLYENRPIGPTPIPPNILAEMKENGSLQQLLEKKLVYQDAKGNYIPKENLYARVPVYLHPDIAEHFNEVVKPKTEAPTTTFGRIGKLYDDVTGNMKSLLLSWSPFHRVTESMRMLESLGLVKGGKLAAQTNLGMAPKIDYFNLTPVQEAAIRDGIVTADPRGKSMSNVEEGLSAGEGNTWGAKSYRLLDKGLEKLGVPPAIRNKINLQKILTDDVFGPQGMITHAKFELYADRKPQIAAQILKDHPDWSAQEIDKHAGQIAARFANNKFGGLNHVLINRALSDQKIWRRLLLAPDFLESTGRSILDLAHPYGNDMAAALIRFNIAHMLTAAGINYALHHNDEDDTVKGAVNASHILDHPYGIVAPNDKSVYGLRTTMTDFLHMVNQPRTFAYDRVSPLLRSADEITEQRNQYGRKESLGEAVKSLPKATLPIQVQNLVGLGPNTTTEPTAGDQFLKSIGIQARPNRSNAEQLAINKVSAKLQGTEARTGEALVRQQLKFSAEDALRDAVHMKDPEAKKAAIAAAQHTIDNLTMRKMITPEERKKITVDAKGSRLASIFNSLTPDDALDVWDKTTDGEKKELSTFMHAKYVRWTEKLAKDGYNVNNLTPEDQATLNRFKQASIQAAEIRNRPEPTPAPKPKKTETMEKKSAPAATESSAKLPEPAAIASSEPLPAPTPIAVAPADYNALVTDAATKYGVDPTLITAMIHRESAGNPVAVSAKGAHGLMQLEPETAKAYGVTDINDPAQNIDAGVHYIADLLKQYDGDEQKALAAYNAGPPAVAKYGGVPPYNETKKYVEAITNR